MGMGHKWRLRKQAGSCGEESSQVGEAVSLAKEFKTQSVPSTANHGTVQMSSCDTL